MTLAEEIAEAEARLEQLKRRAAAADCRTAGCNMKFLGGKNASCDEAGCNCSVPVHQCARCGDCDYGDNKEADEIRARCKEERHG